MLVNTKEQEYFEKLALKSKETEDKPIAKKSLVESRSMVAGILWLLNKSKKLPHKDAFAMARDGYKIPLRIFNSHLPEDTPVLIYFMGNGFLYNQLEVNTLICSRIAEYSQMKVIIPDTRLAPENPLPTSIYDSIEAANYIGDHLKDFNIKTKKLKLAGYCTGASCALAAAENPAFEEVILLSQPGQVPNW